MKKYILSVLASILGLGYAWSSNGLIVNDVILPLSGEATIDINCSFSSTYLGYQLDVVLADGLELVEDNNGKVVCENGFTGTDHTIKSQKKENNIYRFVVVSMDENQLPSSGSLLKMYVRVKDGVSIQDQVNAMVTGARFTTVDFDEDVLTDVNFHINIANKESQSISLSTLPTMTYGDDNYALPTTTVEGLPLTWTSSNTSIATISNNTLTIKNVGTATITASQAGNDSYDSFSHEYQLTVDKAILSITANNCSKQQGEANPPLTVSYNGFKYNDNASSLIVQPTVTTTATIDSPPGTYPIIVSGASSNNYEFTYVNGTLTVTEKPTNIEVTDISQISNVIYLEEVNALVGCEKVLSFQMKNTAAISAFQFDLVLPEGVIPATYANGRIKCSLANGRRVDGDDHSLTVSRQNDGSYRFLSTSNNNLTFTGTEGEIATLTVEIADDMVTGVYPITLKNMKLNEAVMSNFYETAEVVVKLTVDNYVLGDVSGDGIVDVSDCVGIANHILGNTPAGFNIKAADVNMDNKIDVTDCVGVANIILYGTPEGHSGNNARTTNVGQQTGRDPQ